MEQSRGFWSLDKNLIRSYILKYQTINGLLTYCKNLMSGKNLVLDLCLKNIQTNQNTGFFKLQYLANELRYEGFKVKHLQRQKNEAIVLSWCGQACLVIPKVMPNSDSASSSVQLVFRMWVGIHINYKFVQSFQVGVFRK